MVKVKSITVKNYKALAEQEINLNGASAIITAGNNQGKTSLLRGLIDRFRGEKPDIIVKQGEEKGENTMELTDGSKIAWKFTHKTENFSFTTAEDIKMTTGVLSAIGEKYFGMKFNIDKFINSSMKEQLKQVQKLLGVDLSILDQRYKLKFDERTEANREVKRLLALNVQKPEEVVVVDIEALKKEKQELVDKNTKLKEKWVSDNEAHQKEALNHNKIQSERKDRREKFMNDWKIVEQFEDEDAHEITAFIDLEGIGRFYDKMEKPEELKEVSTLIEPEYHSLVEIDKKIEDAYEDKSKFDAYQTSLDAYNKWVKEGTDARKKADDLKADLDKITEEKTKLIKEANLPDGFELTDEGLLYNGLPLDDNQISSSAKYICALKLGALVLGKVRTMHFDASYLDKNSLNDIQKWADENDLQLLIERPDFEGGEITYNIIED